MSDMDGGYSQEEWIAHCQSVHIAHLSRAHQDVAAALTRIADVMDAPARAAEAKEAERVEHSRRRALQDWELRRVGIPTAWGRT